MIEKLRVRRNVIEKSLSHLVNALEEAQRPHADGFLSKLDPRAKLLSAVSMIAVISACNRIPVLVGVLTFAVLLARLSSLSLKRVAAGWAGVTLFAGMIAVPGLVLVPGRTLGHIPLVGWPVSHAGLNNALLLVLRSLGTLTVSLLPVLSTPWPHLLKALRAVRIPSIAIALLAMTYRYIFLLVETAHDMLQSRRSRLVGRVSPQEQRRIMLATSGVLLGKTLQLSDDVYLAMRSRGYTGDIHVLDNFKMSSLDWLVLLTSGALAAILCLIGR
jgi:cobalt/nickel transport system permease protein